MTNIVDQKEAAELEALWPKVTDFLLAISNEAERRCINTATSISDVDNEILKDIANGRMHRALYDAVGLDDEDLKRLHEGVQMDSRQGGGAMSLVILAYNAGRLGLGESNAGTFIFELFKKAGSKGGKIGAETRRQQNEEEYGAEAKRMIVMLRQKHPDYSQSKIADEVVALWKGDMPPSHRTLTRMISKMEKCGEIKPAR